MPKFPRSSGKAVLDTEPITEEELEKQIRPMPEVQDEVDFCGGA